MHPKDFYRHQVIIVKLIALIMFLTCLLSSAEAAPKDYRTAIVLDDVHGAKFSSLKITEPGTVRNPVFSKNSTEVIMNRKVQGNPRSTLYN
jgi:hypothetical protein